MDEIFSIAQIRNKGDERFYSVSNNCKIDDWDWGLIGQVLVKGYFSFITLVLSIG